MKIPFFPFEQPTCSTVWRRTIGLWQRPDLVPLVPIKALMTSRFASCRKKKSSRRKAAVALCPQIKCAQYWPSPNRETELFQEFIVKLSSEDHCPDYTIRHLSVTNVSQENQQNSRFSTYGGVTTQIKGIVENLELNFATRFRVSRRGRRTRSGRWPTSSSWAGRTTESPRRRSSSSSWGAASTPSRTSSAAPSWFTAGTFGTRLESNSQRTPKKELLGLLLLPGLSLQMHANI